MYESIISEGLRRIGRFLQDRARLKKVFGKRDLVMTCLMRLKRILTVYLLLLKIWGFSLLKWIRCANTADSRACESFSLPLVVMWSPDFSLIIMKLIQWFTRGLTITIQARGFTKRQLNMKGIS